MCVCVVMTATVETPHAYTQHTWTLIIIAIKTNILITIDYTAMNNIHSWGFINSLINNPVKLYGI